MKNSQKGFVVPLILAIVAIVVIVCGIYFTQRAVAPSQTQTPTPSVPVVETAPTEAETIQKLTASWKTTQATFAVKAGESGTYNQPDKIQFISANTMLVHYDDGLVDHTSVVQFKNGTFVELKNVGILNTMTQNEWDTLVATYGDAKYPTANYQSSSDLRSYAKVAGNIFVKAAKPPTEVSVRLQKTGTIGDLQITPLEVVQDSRCPANVNCVWAGTVVVKTRVSFKGDAGQEYAIELNKETSTAHGKISLISVEPSIKTPGQVKPEEYAFTFKLN